MTTDQPGSLAEALAAFQAELPTVKKTKTADVEGVTLKGVPFKYKYKYADLADVAETVMPLLGKHGLSISCQPGEREDGRFGLAYQLLHASGERIEGWFPLDATKKMQVIGGDITYARRYCLSAITGVAAEEDTDARGSELREAPGPAAHRTREKPPERAAGNLPRNADGSISRSRTTDDELAATGQMTDAQIRDHGRLERDVKGTGPQGTQRLTETPPDDPWYQPNVAFSAVRAPRAATSKAQQIVMHFERLGVDDKSVRLGYTARLAGLDTLRTTNDLTAQQGIAVERKLASCRDAEALGHVLGLLKEDTGA